MEFLLAAAAVVFLLIFCFRGVFIFIVTIFGMMTGGFWSGITAGLMAYILLTTLKGFLLGYVVAKLDDFTKRR